MAMRGFEDQDAGVGIELPLLRSPLIAPPFVHGFSTRAGGVSPAPFDTLNMGARWGDVAANVEENRGRLLRAVGVAGPLYVVRQVHGAAVARVRAGDDPAAVARIEADALVTDDPGVGLGVFVADCVPALIVDPRTGAVAAGRARQMARRSEGREPAAARARGRRTRRDRRWARLHGPRRSPLLLFSPRSRPDGTADGDRGAAIDLRPLVPHPRSL